MRHSDVLIIGAGPTGLVLALWLTKLGVKVRIVDKTAEPGTTSEPWPFKRGRSNSTVSSILLTPWSNMAIRFLRSIYGSRANRWRACRLRRSART